MSNSEYCPICTTNLLTEATKVYPLCDCKVSLCFDCLRCWAKRKYCCPFCNIPFSQNTIRQTAEELRVRLRNHVALEHLDEVVEAWVNQLTEMRSDMEVGLAMLNIDSDNFSLTIRRARTPVWSLNPYTHPSSSSHLLNILPPMLSTNVSMGTVISVVPPALSQASNSVMGLPYSEAELPATGKVRSSPGFRLNRPNINRTVNDLGFNSSAYLNDRNLRARNFLTIPDLQSSGSTATQLSIDEDSLITSEDEKSLDVRVADHQREAQQTSPIPSINIVRFNDFVQKRCGRMKSILAKRLHVRELVQIRSGSNLARKLEPESVGVIMNYSGGLPVGSNGDLLLEEDHPITLTVRLLDGSWLTDVQVEDVEAQGKRATLRQYLRVGDLLWTRFGIAMTCELHPKSGQVTVRYPNGIVNSKEDFSIDNLEEVCKEVRTELFGPTAETGCNERENIKEENYKPILCKNEESKVCAEEFKAFTKSPVETEEKIVLEREMKIDRTEMRKTERASVMETDVKERPSRQDFFEMPLKKNSDSNYEDLRTTERPSRPISDSELNDLPKSLEDPDAFDKSDFILISCSSNSRPGDSDSFRPPSDIPQHGTRPSRLLTDKPLLKSVSSIEVKTKRIYEGDIKSVFSAQDIFEVIEKKVAEEVIASYVDNPRVKRAGPSSNSMASLQPPRLEPLEECNSRDVSNDGRDGFLYVSKDGMFDDVMLSPWSVKASYEAILDFGKVSHSLG